MDNVTLINQARQLCAVLEVARHTEDTAHSIRIQRLDNLLLRANLRYQRRINRCALCYQLRFLERYTDPHIVPCAHAAFNWSANVPNEKSHPEETTS